MEGDKTTDRGASDSSDGPIDEEAAAVRRLVKASCLRCGSSELCPYRGYGRDELWYEINQRLDLWREIHHRLDQPAPLHDAAWCATEHRTILNLVWHYGQAEGNWQQSYSEYTGEGWVCGKCQGGDFECHSPRCIKRECPIPYQAALSDAGLKPITVYIDPRAIASMAPPTAGKGGSVTSDTECGECKSVLDLTTAIKYRIQQVRAQPGTLDQDADSRGIGRCAGCHMLAFVVYDSMLQWCKRCYPAAAPFSPDTQPKEWQARREEQEVAYGWRHHSPGHRPEPKGR